MVFQAASPNDGMKKSCGRSAGRGDQWKRQSPFSDWNQGDLDESFVRASSADGYTIIVACGFSTPAAYTVTLFHSGVEAAAVRGSAACPWRETGMRMTDMQKMIRRCVMRVTLTASPILSRS